MYPRRYEAQYRMIYFLDSKYPVRVAHASGATEAKAAWGKLLAYYLQKIIIADLHAAITLPYNQIVDFDMFWTRPYARPRGDAKPS